jgi:D-threo-aldose 1-dehydrogenase
MARNEARPIDIVLTHNRYTLVNRNADPLQFSLRDPRITSTICGVSKPERVAETWAWAAVLVPDALWEEVTALPFSSDDPEASRVYNPG